MYYKSLLNAFILWEKFPVEKIKILNLKKEKKRNRKTIYTHTHSQWKKMERVE